MCNHSPADDIRSPVSGSAVNARTYLIISAGAFAALILYVQSPECAYAARIFSDFVGWGRSLWKGILCFAWVGILTGWMAFGRRCRSPLLLAGILSAVVLSMWLLSLALYYWTYRHFDLQLLGYQTFVQDGDFSTSRLEHMHLFKGIVATLLKMSGQSLVLPGDFGGPFASIVPVWSTLTGAFLVPLAFVLAIPLYGECISRAGRFQRGVAVLYPLSSFAVLKSLIDGGPLAVESVAAAPFFFWMLWGRGRTPARFWFAGLCLASFCTNVLDWTEIFSIGAVDGRVRHVLRNMLFWVAAFAAPGWRAVAAIALLLPMSWDVRWIRDGGRLFSYLPANAEVVITSNRLAVPVEEKFREGKMVRVELSSSTPVRQIDIYRSLGVPQSYDIMRIVGVDCSRQVSKVLTHWVTLIEPSNLPLLKPSRLASRVRISERSELPRSGLQRFKIQIDAESCNAERSSIIMAAYLHGQGLRRFIVGW